MTENRIKAVFIHCSATPPSMDIGAEEITRWHLERGFSAIGYHYVIRRNGHVEKGRDLDGDGDVTDEMGAHAYGHNRGTLGICLVGGIDENGRPDFNYTRYQMNAAEKLVAELVARFPGVEVKGHRDVDSGKACPCFDVGAWWVA